jgi:hypothetical protein
MALISRIPGQRLPPRRDSHIRRSIHHTHHTHRSIQQVTRRIHQPIHQDNQDNQAHRALPGTTHRRATRPILIHIRHSQANKRSRPRRTLQGIHCTRRGRRSLATLIQPTHIRNLTGPIPIRSSSRRVGHQVKSMRWSSHGLSLASAFSRLSEDCSSSCSPR